jgi:hypothetical protein
MARQECEYQPGKQDVQDNVEGIRQSLLADIVHLPIRATRPDESALAELEELLQQTLRPFVSEAQNLGNADKKMSEAQEACQPFSEGYVPPRRGTFASAWLSSLGWYTRPCNHYWRKATESLRHLLAGLKAQEAELQSDYRALQALREKYLELSQQLNRIRVESDGLDRQS